eukprot:233836-Chlamydomonas_euryale.AAC.5
MKARDSCPGPLRRANGWPRSWLDYSKRCSPLLYLLLNFTKRFLLQQRCSPLLHLLFDFTKRFLLLDFYYGKKRCSSLLYFLFDLTKRFVLWQALLAASALTFRLY